MLRRISLFILLASFVNGSLSAGDFADLKIDGEPLKLEAFITEGIKSDTKFEEILVSALILVYQKNIRLPAPDLVLSVKEQYHLFLEPGKDRGETSISLSKLFPMTGTELEASYASAPVSATQRNTTTVNLQLTQSIAENAFGRNTRLLDKIVGLEVDIARHQVTEAYEDYLFFIILTYFEWYETYRNFEISSSSYRENLKLLTNIRNREKSNIALPIDVNKVELQVLDKGDSLRESYDAYLRKSNIIKTILRTGAHENWIPTQYDYDLDFENGFDEAYADFKSQSRTYQVLNLLEERSALQVDRDADDLLPSIDVFLGYEIEGTDFGLDDNDRLFYAGAQIDWPFPDTVEKAEYEVAKLNHKQTTYNVESTHYNLYAQLKNIFFEIERERALLQIAEKKIHLAEAVLRDEAENYSFGKVTLNDYIQAVNVFDRARFNHVLRDVRLKKLILQWKRLTDTLISADELPATR